MIYEHEFIKITGREVLKLDPRIAESRWFVVEDELVFMQFTGLLDKNGKDIYEGDIGERNMDYISYMGKPTTVYHRDRWVVERHGASFLTVLIGGKPNPYSQRFSELGIIGNIYENPELLTLSKPQQ